MRLCSMKLAFPWVQREGCLIYNTNSYRKPPYDRLEGVPDPKGSHSLPVNLHRIIQNAKQIFHIDPRKLSDLEPAHIVQSVKDLGGCLNIVPGNDPLSREAQDNAALTFQMHLRTMFVSRCVLEQFHWTREAFDWVLGEVEAKFNQSLADPGEMCGTLAAQSIGEPTK
jgi:DNA-directed RNA polymerase II subunit RPB1